MVVLAPDGVDTNPADFGSDPDGSEYLALSSVNSFARSTPWLNGPMVDIATYGVVLFGMLLVAGWWLARRSGDVPSQAAAWWAPLGTLLAVAVNQPIAAILNEARPVVALPGAYILVPGKGTRECRVTTR